MPLICDAVIELRERLGISQSELGELLGEIRVAKPWTNPAYSEKMVNAWEEGHQAPSVDTLDGLYQLARTKGYENLEFYERP